MSELDRLGLPVLDPAALPGPPAPVAATLPWQPPHDGSTVRALADTALGDPSFDLGRFARWLREADVLDQDPIELPGATVTLPHGMRLIRRFDELAMRTYEQAGFEQYDYPMLVPDSVLTPTRRIMPLDGALVYAGDDEDWAAGRKRMVLTPTGEGAVYTHWAKLVRTRQDLPLLTYRRARYFRPARSGRSVFRAIEAPDIFEFQACYADRAEAEQGLRTAVAMARTLAERMHVPVLWSRRPPWTNNEGVSETTIGGDVPLPHGGTLQVGCLYDQGQRFSRVYDVGFRDGAERHHTHHVTGALTRRLVLTHLMLGMDADGELLVHPDLAPTQVALTLTTEDARDRAEAEQLVARLTEAGLRCELRIAPARGAAGRLHRRWRRQGVPLRVYLQPRRDPADRIRAVVVRADTREEAVLLPEHLADLAEPLVPAVAEVGHGYRRRAFGFAADQCHPAHDEAAVRKVLAQRAVALTPLAATKEAVVTVAGWGLGEVLGFRESASPAPCAVTGVPTTTLAYVSPRV
ncbi:hypothetical protein [Kitasatospora sp. LaBMicrA B282]|uniref:hypothetical protein n=1 Tax=Kitasatospora sp. LaBMicrA B282 TaxID=3420949 RepID=UPI003D0CA112